MSNNQLPNGWINAPIGDICELINGRAFKPTEWKDSGLPIIRIQNLNNANATFNYFDGEVLDKHKVKTGNLLFAWSGTPGTSFGAHVWKGSNAVLNQHIFKIDFSESLISKNFFRYAINQKLDELIGHAQGGVGLRHVTKGTFEKTKLAFPPLAEQKEIAARLDGLLAQVDALKTRLDFIPNILKRFRQSVLAAAVSGKLTGDEINTRNNWKTVEFSELLDQIRSGSADKPSDENSGIPILRSSAIRDMVIDYNDIRYLDGFANVNKENYLRKHDLIFTRLSGSAEYVGNCAVVKSSDKEKIQYPDRLFCARLKNKSHASYLEFFFSSSAFKSHISENLKSSAGHQRITLDVIKKVIVFLPPIKEQTEIVRRVEELFAFADQVEQQVKAAQQRVNHLTQAILAKAFRGELTAQWREQNPDLISGENSAAALLARIKAEKQLRQIVAKPSRRQTTSLELDTTDFIFDREDANQR